MIAAISLEVQILQRLIIKKIKKLNSLHILALVQTLFDKFEINTPYLLSQIYFILFFFFVRFEFSNTKEKL